MNMKIRTSVVLLIILPMLVGCASIKQGESWKMQPKDKTIGLTLLWNLLEAKIREIVPDNQTPRIQNGTGVLMLFLCSTDTYYIGEKQYGKLGVAHLIVPLENEISIPETIGLKNQAIISGLKKKGFGVQFGDVRLRLEEEGDWVNVKGDIILERGEMHFSGRAENMKGKQVSLSNTTLVGKNLQEDVLSGPEFYKPISFKSITVNQKGENWIQKYDLTSLPNRIWVNVDFGVDFKYFNLRPNKTESASRSN